MLKNKHVEVNLTSQNIKHYESLKYEIPKYTDKNGKLRVKKGTKLTVKIEDVPSKTASVRILVYCDYCGKLYNPTIVDFNNGRKYFNKDSCGDCRHKKQQETYFYLYNTNSTKSMSEIKGFKLGRNKISFSIIKEEFFKHGLILQINEKDYINTKTPVPFICTNHKEYGIQYKSYDSLKRSKHCCEIGAIENNSGENACNWKGGISSERDKIMNTKIYKEWRESIYQKDNYTCQCCGDNNGGNLNAHHINNFSECPDLRFDINNGITLCDKCHNPNKYGSFHNTYGTFNNTKEQLEEYIGRYKSGEFNKLREQNVS